MTVNPKIKTQLLEIIRAGNYVTTAMMALGLSDDFYYHCQERAEQGRPEFVKFVAELKKAESEAEIALTKRMLLGKEHFLPAATMLERRFRDRYGRSDRHQLEANVSIRVELPDYSRLVKQIGAKKAR